MIATGRRDKSHGLVTSARLTGLDDACPASLCAAMLHDDRNLHLAGVVPVGSGLRRTIYLHPTDDTTLVKVDKGNWPSEAPGWLRKVKRRVIPSIPERDKFVEAGEAMRAAMRAQGLGLRLPIPAFRGFVNTDLGLATLHERIVNPDGTTARALKPDAVPPGPVADDERDAVADMMRRLLALNVVVRDLHPNNIVVSASASAPICTLVDGYGDWATVRLRSMSPRLNASKTHRMFQRFAARIHAVWDAEAQTLTPFPRT